jgi:hypothetical protein
LRQAIANLDITAANPPGDVDLLAPESDSSNHHRPQQNLRGYQWWFSIAASFKSVSAK